MTGFARVLPDVLVIGAQKAGTNSIGTYLSTHPDVYWAGRSEVHYFDENASRGVDWYRAWFPLASTVRAHEKRTGHKPVVAEKTPNYLIYPGVDERVHELLPEVRLLVAMRHPVDRAFSHWRMSRRKGFEPLSFVDAIRAEPDRLADGLVPKTFRGPEMRQSYVARGRYGEQIERWLRVFRPDQLVAYRSEDLIADPRTWGSHICAHIGLDPARFDVGRFPHANAGDPLPFDDDVRAELESCFIDDDARLLELTGLSYFHGCRDQHRRTDDTYSS